MEWVGDRTEIRETFVDHFGTSKGITLRLRVHETLH
jgi:hypothetical protein